MPTVTAKSSYPFFQKSTYTDTRFPGQVFVLANSATQYQVGTDSRTLNDDKDWRQKIAKGQDASNAYELKRKFVHPYTIHTQTRQVLSSYRTEAENFLRFAGSGFDLLNAMPVDSALRDLALVRFKRKISSNMGQKGLAVPTAELRELRGLIKQTALMGVATVKSLLALRKGNLTPLTRQIGDVWLYFSFGVSPFLKDIAEITDAIRKYLEREDHTVRIASGAEKTWLSSVKDTGTTGTLHSTVESRTDMLHTLFYKYTGGFDFQVKSSNDYGVASTFGLEVPELPSILWELTAFSWMFDYFTNIGEYLGDTLVVPPGATKYLVLSTKYTVVGNVYPSPKLNAGCEILSNSVRPGVGEFVHFTRTKVSALPRVGLHFKTEDQIGKNAVNKLLNLAALLTKGIPRGSLNLKGLYSSNGQWTD